MITQVRRKTTPLDIAKAHVQLGAKIINPKEYVGLYLRHKEGKGFVYSDKHRYLGPGNPLPASGEGIKPYSMADAQAYIHDRSYHHFEERTGKKPYMYWHKSDQDLIDRTKFTEPDELVAKYAFTAKKGLYKAGLLEAADNVPDLS